ncbi:unnamed protein product [Mycena citricolor]|uniref:Uncharacterized protein n=1 Tax=Mycena citricolor TaxID=2018698 RepID=A0AAD2K0Y8_9AGAR|nr:unnamed protein product [Mycena citricolor]
MGEINQRAGVLLCHMNTGSGAIHDITARSNCLLEVERVLFLPPLCQCIAALLLRRPFVDSDNISATL